MGYNWYCYVDDHLDELNQSDTREAKALIALFSLDLEYDNGGLIQYLMNSSGDTWEQLKDAFELGNCPRGIEWMKGVEGTLGRAMPRDRDDRIDAITAMAKFGTGVDPFDEMDAILAEGLIDDVQEIGKSLVRSHQAGQKTVHNMAKVQPLNRRGSD